MFGGINKLDLCFYLLGCPDRLDHTEYGQAVYLFKGEPIWWDFGKNEARLIK